MNAFTPAFAEPFTPRGVAAFARAKTGWLLLTQTVVALVAAVSLACFLDDNCYSVIHEAILNLPDAGKIAAGRLDWQGHSPQMLAEGRLLALDVDLGHSGAVRSTADVQVEFGRDSLRIYSILPGYSEFFYPEWPVPFNRLDLEPLWNAWAVEILFLSGVTAFVVLLLIWVVLATAYFPPVWVAVFFANRDLNLCGCWKLSAAALLPGALLMIAGIWLYNFGLLRLVSLTFIIAGHFVLGWIYIAAALIFLPPVSRSTPKGNPFGRS
ncbi:MAG TPA: hypothetical protein VMH30_01430 [Verrucomicrobiae bacterium]|nr:hypothetical protein [Verrucomicrobiae bacterium]